MKIYHIYHYPIAIFVDMITIPTLILTSMINLLIFLVHNDPYPYSNT